ncbi:MAG TPA: type IVB secretion system protein IcmQ [Gammaproteobacteria bacterium]|nr:type IVB secretion system protein IcmQ [Gammaproteobacteria bacterium]
MPIRDEIEEYEKLIRLIQDLIQQDADLREKYGILEKFRFVRDRLNGLLTHLEEQKKALRGDKKIVETEVDSADRVVVYVYLYNAQGTMLRTWLTLLTPKVFYEYSVNRPIYGQKNEIESLIRSKPNPQQHGYLTVKVSQKDMMALKAPASMDTIGNPLLKIREGSLRFENLVTFTHNGHDYVLNAEGELVKAG